MFTESHIFMTKWQALPPKTRKAIAAAFLFGDGLERIGTDSEAWKAYHIIQTELDRTTEWLKQELIRNT
jgi:hypothetical protein